MNKIICKRLTRGEDLMSAIKHIASEESLQAAVILSAVGCVSAYRIRAGGGAGIFEEKVPCEIVALNGTVSEKRIHLHIALSKPDLSTVGGHLQEGCIIDTTCELVIGSLEQWHYESEEDSQTGYKEIIFKAN